MSRVKAIAVTVVTAATAGGAALRLATAPYLSFRGDELATVKWSMLPAGEMMRTFGQGATSHLYDLFMHLWIGAFGLAPLLVKLPSLVAGVAVIPLVYALGCRWLDRETATVAALMAALSSPMILYARVARPYALLTIGVLASMYLFTKAVDVVAGDRDGSGGAARGADARRPDAGDARGASSRRGNADRRPNATVFRNRLVMLALVNATLLATSLNAAYVLMVQGAALGMITLRSAELRRRRAIGVCGSFALTIVLAVAFYARALPAIAGAAQSEAARSYRLSLPVRTFAFNHPSATILFGVVFGVGIVAAWRCDEFGARLLVLWATLPPLLYVLSRTSYPVAAISRYLVATLPAQFLLAGLGFVVVARLLTRRTSELLARRAGNRRAEAWISLPAALLAATVAMTWNVDLWRPRSGASIFDEIQPTTPAITRLAAVAQPGDVVISGLETRLYWLLRAQEGLLAKEVDEATAHPNLEQPGRLILLTQSRPQARSWWSRRFHLEVIGDERFRLRFFLLVSDELPAAPGALREPLRDFLQGYVEEVAAGLSPDPWRASRQCLVVARSHALLARLVDDPRQRQAHVALAEKYRRQARESLAAVGSVARR